MGDEDRVISTDTTFKIVSPYFRTNALSSVTHEGYICVVGKQFSLMCENGVYFVHNPEKRKDYVHSQRRWRRFFEDDPPLEEGKRVDEGIIKLSSILNAPVFVLKSRSNDKTGNKYTIDHKIPILGNLGFASLYSADQLYQDIAYFLTNIMNESPDMLPPTKQPDKDKITSHGFDLKKSFRHRK